MARMHRYKCTVLKKVKNFFQNLNGNTFTASNALDTLEFDISIENIFIGWLPTIAVDLTHLTKCRNQD